MTDEATHGKRRFNSVSGPFWFFDRDIDLKIVNTHIFLPKKARWHRYGDSQVLGLLCRWCVSPLLDNADIGNLAATCSKARNIFKFKGHLNGDQ